MQVSGLAGVQPVVAVVLGVFDLVDTRRLVRNGQSDSTRLLRPTSDHGAQSLQFNVIVPISKRSAHPCDAFCKPVGYTRIVQCLPCLFGDGHRVRATLRGDGDSPARGRPWIDISTSSFPTSA